jgi:S-adenosylmethionine synthetase
LIIKLVRELFLTCAHAIIKMLDLLHLMWQKSAATATAGRTLQ